MKCWICAESKFGRTPYEKFAMRQALARRLYQAFGGAVEVLEKMIVYYYARELREINKHGNSLAAANLSARLLSCVCFFTQTVRIIIKFDFICFVA